MSRPVTLHGATGPNRAVVNGTYVPTAERLNDKPVYAKEGDADRWLFFATDKSWYVTTGRENMTANKAAGITHTETGLAHPAAAKAWRVWDGSKWDAQPLEVSIVVRVHPRLH